MADKIFFDNTLNPGIVSMANDTKETRIRTTIDKSKIFEFWPELPSIIDLSLDLMTLPNTNISLTS